MEKNKGLSLTIKGLIVGFLILLLLIPALIIGNLIEERSERQKEVAREVSGKWASRQTLTGPILMIPYLETSTERVKEGKSVSEIEKQERKMCYVLPDQLKIDGQLETQIRKRSIFSIAVYQVDARVEGTFAPVDFEELGVRPEDLLLAEAQVCFGVSDFRGIQEQLSIVWDGEAKPLRTGAAKTAVLAAGMEFDGQDDYRTYQEINRPASGLSAPVNLSAGDAHTFSVELKLRGSEQFNVTPLGKTTEVKLASSWPDPSFRGMFLPNNPATITKEGFEAEWKVMYLNRDYPQSWKGDDAYAVRSSDFGVELLQPTDNYAKTLRSVKYAILLIALTLVLYFLLEVLQRRNVHPLQYAMVGLALCLFYTLLLSIGEYTGFNWAYLIATAATISLIGWYSYSIFKKRGIVLLIVSVLGILYLFIFILLQLQDGALLAGSVGLFVLLAAIMHYSRKVDWQNEDAALPESETPAKRQQ